MFLSPMRAVLSIILLLGVSAPFVLAELDPSAKPALSATTSLVDVSMAATPVLAAPDNLVMRDVAMGLGIMCLALAGYMAFGPKPRPAAVKVAPPTRE